MRVAIVGGGVAGASTALYLAEMGVCVTLFEKEEFLVSGPPFCHLHAGGNLYPDISDSQCLKLLKQSIDFAKFYPKIIDYRPTVLTFPKSCKLGFESLKDRLVLLKNEYEKLIQKDITNKVLGDSKDYFKVYDKNDLNNFDNLDEWMRAFVKYVDLDSIKFPVVLVREYGLNLFRLSAILNEAILNHSNIDLKLKTTVFDIKKDEQWSIKYLQKTKRQEDNFDYLINATGFQTGVIDDMIGVKCKKMVEFKAAYITKWEDTKDTLLPEIIFHGKRGTPNGMGQFTPYPHGFFQLHGMTEDITLYKDGLVSNKVKCQPKLGNKFIKMIEKGWSKDEINQRASNAIKHISKYIPLFSKAKFGYKPLYGAQQIPGDDPSLRVAEVTFATKNYARCEIVKVSSVFDMIDAIVCDIFGKKMPKKSSFDTINTITEEKISKRAKEIAIKRGYPKELSSRVNSFLS